MPIENQPQDLEALTIQNYDVNATAWATGNRGTNWGWAIAQFKTYLPTGRILEIGCGGGRDAALLEEEGFDYLGTDASTGMIKAAQIAVPQAKFQKLNIYDLEQLNQTFDGFWACATLLHIPRARLDGALSGLNHVLKQGAVGMISVKDGEGEEFEVRDHKGLHEERLFIYWHKDNFVHHLEQSGFKVLDYIFKPVDSRVNWHVFFVKKVHSS